MSTEHKLISLCLACVISVAMTVGTARAADAALKPTDTVGILSAEQASRVATDFPGLAMKSGVLMTADGRELWARQPDERRAMASITKIMTAIVVLDRLSLDDTAIVPPEALTLGESESQLKKGETLTVSDLMEALLVKSGNDAAVTLAERVAGSEDEFVKLMNQKAADLGLSNTRFANAHGLDEDGNYSTAEDLAVLARYAMTRQAFRDVVKLSAARIGDGKTVRMVEASNRLIGAYPGANGVKTGWTSDAGYSVVASAARGEIELYAVVLGTGSEKQRFSDARKILDWGFAHYRPQRVASENATAGAVAVTDFIDKTVPVVASRDETVAVFDTEGAITHEIRLVQSVGAPVKRGQRLGSLAVLQGNRLIATVPLIAASDVPAPGLLERVSIALRRLWLRLRGGPTVAATTAVS